MLSSVKNLVFTWWRYALVAVAVLVIGGYFYIGNGNGKEATLTITSGDFIRKVGVSGTVIAVKDVDLGFAANGRISGAYAKVGQRVSAGTILAETENGDLVATLSKKKFSLDEAKANLTSLQTGTRSEEIAIANTSVANAKAALIDAIKNAYTASDDAVRNKADAFFTNPRTDPKLSFIVSNAVLKSAVESDRAKVEASLLNWNLLIDKLSLANSANSAKQAQTYLSQVATLLANANLALNQGIPDSTTSASDLTSYASTLATARTSVNNIATALTTAIATLDSAEKNLNLKQAGSTSDSIIAQTAAVAVAEADVKNAEAILTTTRVVAPFTGIVTRMGAKVGEIVSPTASLISMQSDGIFQIETYIPEVVISGVAVGNSATTTLDAYGTSAEFPAVVVAVDPAETIKDGVPAYKTTLSFLSADSRIRSGMTANVLINIGTLHNAVVIPSGAVSSKDGSPYVSVRVNEKSENRTVVTGTSPALGQVEILSGLSVGDVILLSPMPAGR